MDYRIAGFLFVVLVIMLAIMSQGAKPTERNRRRPGFTRERKLPDQKRRRP
jgi:hypothetical protein